MKLNLKPVEGMSKPDRIEFLLEHWLDFHETIHSVDHDHEGGGDGDAVTAMPAMYWHPSVVELRRCIDAAKKDMPVRVAHLLAFYESEWRNTTQLGVRKTKKGRMETVEGRVRQRIVPKWVRRSKVDAAFVYLVKSFQGTVHIPSELLEDIVQQAA